MGFFNLKLAEGLGIYLAGVVCGAWLTLLVKNADIAALKLEHTTTQLQTVTVLKDRLLAIESARQTLENELSTKEAKHYGDLKDVQERNTQLVDSLAAARQRMRVPVTAASCRQYLSQAPASGGVDDATVTVELQPATAADLARLAADADTCAVKLTALQDWANTVAEPL